MRIHVLTVILALAAAPASAQESALAIGLVPGHTIHHEAGKEAGVAMVLTIKPGHARTATLTGLCDELRVAAGLANENADGLRLRTLFIVPYKAMAVEGYYLADDEHSDEAVLIPGDGVARPVLDRIVARVGIPPGILDEPDVEQEISCALDEPLWYIGWQDVRPIGDDDPETVIERAHERFVAVHQRVVEHAARKRPRRLSFRE